MARRTSITEAEIKRAIKAAQALGLQIAGVRLEDGKVTVVIGEGDMPPLVAKPSVNEWDEVLQ